MLKKAVMMAALALALAPTPSQADGLFTVNFGSTFGNDAKDHEHATYGASVGWMGAGVFGFEANFDYTPGFFKPKGTDVDLIDKSNVTSLMGNILLGIPVGGQRGLGVRPYGTAGVGLLRTNLESAGQLFKIKSNDFGVNLGGGLFIFFGDHVGIRGDARYFRDLNSSDDANPFNLDLGSFDFWRGTGGLTLRW